jgi:hypothetical protein
MNRKGVRFLGLLLLFFPASKRKDGDMAKRNYQFEKRQKELAKKKKKEDKRLRKLEKKEAEGLIDEDQLTEGEAEELSEVDPDDASGDTDEDPEI